jgi:hypothetical protein
MTLRRRETNHRSTGNDASSKHIPDYIDWTIKLLEEVTNDQGITKEQYYFDTLKPLYNRCRPGQSVQESQKQSNKKRMHLIVERNKPYQQSDAYKEYQRQYRAKKKSEKEISTTN